MFKFNRTPLQQVIVTSFEHVCHKAVNTPCLDSESLDEWSLQKLMGQTTLWDYENGGK